MRSRWLLLAGAVWVDSLGAAARARPVAFLASVTGLVEVRAGGPWRPAGEGARLSVGDTVRTGADSLATIEYLDGRGGASPTTIDVSPVSEARLERFEISGGPRPRRVGFLAMLRGALRAVTKGWSRGSIFSVRAGTTVCGIRGSVARVAFDPGTAQASFTNLEGAMFSYPAPDLATAVRVAARAGRDLAAGRPPRGVKPFTPGQLVLADREGAEVIEVSEAGTRLRALTARFAAARDRLAGAGTPEGRAEVAAELKRIRFELDALAELVLGR